jgi:hypothetical protein
LIEIKALAETSPHLFGKPKSKPFCGASAATLGGRQEHLAEKA